MAEDVLNNQTPRQALGEVTDEVKNYLHFLSEMGCRGLNCSEKSLDVIKDWGTVKKVVRPKVPQKASDTLEKIRADLGDCRRCGLSKERRNLVFGAGNPHARLMFIGEAPGFEEDRQGLPFVGASGRLLTKMIGAMTLSRDEVYIGNIIKCRPPGNRNPFPEEILNCSPFLERQVLAIKPQVICTLGAFATQALLGTSNAISRLRGRFHEFRSIKVMPTYHPAFLLRNPASKRAAWEDLQKIMAVLGLQRKG